MAVFQAARLRSTALPAPAPARLLRRRSAALPAPAATVRRRGAASTAVHATTGVRPAGLLMAGILVSTMLGLAYLTQTLGSSATSSEIRALQSTANGLDRRLSAQSVQAARLTDADVVIAKARQQGLHKLDDRVVLRAP